MFKKVKNYFKGLYMALLGKVYEFENCDKEIHFGYKELRQCN